MALAMRHRGPDDMGTWSDAAGPVGLAQRRLSIIDLSPAGHNPMSNEDGTVWITYNGEVYNFPELRAELIAKGHQFRSKTDTEVIVHLYEEEGADCLKRLNGMFAFALWDAKKQQLLLARDHAGIKPLYYWQDGRRLFFASEIKALLKVPGCPRELNTAAVSDYLTFLWVPGSFTLFKSIRKLEPGHYLIWKDGSVEERQWFSLAYQPDDGVREAEWIEQVHDTFMRVCRRQMVSDVPLGAFLSGGADSSSIVACMRRSFPEREIKCYTVQVHAEDNDSRDQFVDDYPYAKKVADALGVTLKSVELRADVISLLPKMVYHLDEPDADTAIFPSYLISKLAREDGTTVLLSGTGGDEVFFGYRGHQALAQYERLDRLPRWLVAPALAMATAASSAVMGASGAIPRRLRKFRKGFVATGLNRYMALSDWSGEDVRESIFSPAFIASQNGHGHGESVRKYYEGFEGRGELNRRSHVLVQTFLSAHNFLYTDKTSMATSLEVRVPFMDVELMRLCARIPESFKLHRGTTKYVLKKAMERHLPHESLYRSKTGFGGPLRKWIADDLNGLIGDLLGPERIKQRGLFDPAAVKRIVDDNRANRADHAYLIYALLNLELWMQTFIDRPGEEVSI